MLFCPTNRVYVIAPKKAHRKTDEVSLQSFAEAKSVRHINFIREGDAVVSLHRLRVARVVTFYHPMRERVF